MLYEHVRCTYIQHIVCHHIIHWEYGNSSARFWIRCVSLFGSENTCAPCNLMLMLTFQILTHSICLEIYIKLYRNRNRSDHRTHNYWSINVMIIRFQYNVYSVTLNMCVVFRSLCKSNPFSNRTQAFRRTKFFFVKFIIRKRVHHKFCLNNMPEFMLSTCSYPFAQHIETFSNSFMDEPKLERQKETSPATTACKSNRWIFYHFVYLSSDIRWDEFSPFIGFECFMGFV